MKIKLPDGTSREIHVPSPIGTIDDYRRGVMRHHAREYRVNNPRFFPCSNCEGAEWIYDPNDPPDIIEGNKGRRTIKCPVCKGTGETSRKEFIERFKKAKARQKNLIEKKKAQIRATQAALNKLTPEEFQLIRNINHL